MKRTIAAIALFITATAAHAQFTANAIRFNQRLPDNSGFIPRDLPPPADNQNGIVYLNGSTQLPSMLTLGTGLSITDGVLSSSAGGVNADWNATTGLARILNKPSISTAGMTGQYGDLIGKPVNVSDFANDASYVTSSSLSSALSSYATNAALNTGLAGKDSAGAAAAAQAFAIQRANHTGTQPVSTISGLAPVATSGAYADLTGKPALAAVASSGSYNDLINKPVIPVAVSFNFGQPVARTLSISTAYQATDPAKAAIITISPQCSASLTLVTGSTCSMQARIGSAGLTCSTGTVAATWVNGNTGALTVGLALNQVVGSPASLNLPIGGYFILCPTVGTFTINSAVDQSAG